MSVMKPTLHLYNTSGCCEFFFIENIVVLPSETAS